MYMRIDGKSDPEGTHSAICQGIVNDRWKFDLLHDLVEFLLGISYRHRRKGDIWQATEKKGRSHLHADTFLGPLHGPSLYEGSSASPSPTRLFSSVLLLVSLLGQRVLGRGNAVSSGL